MSKIYKSSMDIFTCKAQFITNTIGGNMFDLHLLKIFCYWIEFKYGRSPKKKKKFSGSFQIFRN